MGRYFVLKSKDTENLIPVLHLQFRALLAFLFKKVLERGRLSGLCMKQPSSPYPRCRANSKGLGCDAQCSRGTGNRQAHNHI